MAFGKKTDRAGLQAVLELKNVDYSKDPEIQQLYTRLVNLDAASSVRSWQRMHPHRYRSQRLWMP